MLIIILMWLVQGKEAALQRYSVHCHGAGPQSLFRWAKMLQQAVLLSPAGLELTAAHLRSYTQLRRNFTS